jgi:adenylate cyclase
VTPLIAVAVAAAACTVLGIGLGFRRNLRVPGSIVETTVLFGDVSGSTQHLVEKGSERHRQEVEAVLRQVQRAVRKHQGEVERTLGDGFIATFQATEDHALDAALAALEISHLLKDLREHGKTSLDMTLGLESGPVTGGYVLEQGRRSWSSAGQAVNLAQRIQASCGELGIEVGLGPVATALIGRSLNVKQVAVRPMKGFDQDISISTME